MSSHRYIPVHLSSVCLSSVCLSSVYWCWWVVLALLLAPEVSAHESSLLKRGGVDWYHSSSKFSLELSVGHLGTDGIDDARPTLTLAPRFDLGNGKRSNISLALPLSLTADEQPLNWTDEMISDGVSSGDLELGSTIILAPSLEWTSCRQPCSQPSVFLGAGARFDRGRSVEVEGFGTYTTKDSTQPVVTAGAAWNAPLSPKLSFRLELRLLTTFYDELEVVLPGGGVVDIDVGDQTSALISFGFQRRF